jgi:methyl-accepting chemotaxis protein
MMLAMADNGDVMQSIDRSLARMEEHMARGNEHMVRGNEHMARGNELMARGNELIRANQQAFEDVGVSLRQMMGVITDQSRVLNEQTAVLKGVAVELRSGRQEFRDEMHAQRRALFAILDHLQGHEPGQG